MPNLVLIEWIVLSILAIMLLINVWVGLRKTRDCSGWVTTTLFLSCTLLSGLLIFKNVVNGGSFWDYFGLYYWQHSYFGALPGLVVMGYLLFMPDWRDPEMSRWLLLIIVIMFLSGGGLLPILTLCWLVFGIASLLDRD